MSFDLTRSYFGDIKERAVLDGTSIAEEGTLLVYVDAGDGTLAVDLATGANTDIVAGWAITDALKLATRTVVEELVVPAGGGSVSLRNTNLVAASSRVYDVTADADLTEAGSSPPASGQYFLTDSTGVIEFHADEAGNTVRVFYRYSPTLEELLATDHERSINNRAQDFFSTVSVGCMEGEIFTSMYDTTQAYAVGDAVFSEAGGLVTSAAGGTQVGFVSQVPSVSDGLLGVKFSGIS